MGKQPGVKPLGMRLKAEVRGLVQGVGFRPFVYRLARRLGLKGWVSNTPGGVLIEAEGDFRDLELFLSLLPEEKPASASIQSLESSYLDIKGYEKFEIRQSGEVGEKETLIMPDAAACPECIAEIFDPAGRRYRYPFTNCTHCGPRYSILEGLPYDRSRTTMKNFQMCPDCEREYHDPADRRFHAQPNACPACGPRVEIWTRRGEVLFSGDDALKFAAAVIQEGRSLALKGLGGFQLIVDAGNSEAVLRLRRKKRREAKPFALMAPDLDSVKEHCLVSEAEKRLLMSPAAPIVLLKRRAGRPKIAEEAASGNPYLGFMLPYTPLHHILLSDLGLPVVATSGNVAEEPMIIDERAAVEKLGDTADYFLVHNRPIARQVDDSVARIVMNRGMILRRARGYSPLPIISGGVPEVPLLSVGAHLKNTVAQSMGGKVFLSQHIGDLESQRSFETFKNTVKTFGELYEKPPEIIAADANPAYLSSSFAKRDGRRIIEVQHHYAHVLSCMAENELEGPVLGVSWDGAGLGPDGTVWGGEFLWVDESRYVRAAHLRRFRLPGGDKAALEPRRSALGVLYEIFGEELFRMKFGVLDSFSRRELTVLRSMLRQKLQSPVTSSAGRLFDAAAAVLGIRDVHLFEGQAAMELEFAAEKFPTKDSYPFWFSGCSSRTDPSQMRFDSHHSVQTADWEPVIRGMLSDYGSGMSAGKVAAKFHNSLAEAILHVASSVRERKVVLTGGCFQNKYLLERTAGLLREKGFSPYWHQRVPTNDGGIALGQIMGAARILKSETKGKKEQVCA